MSEYIAYAVREKFGHLFNKSYDIESHGNEVVISNNGVGIMVWIPQFADIVELIKVEAEKSDLVIKSLQVYPHPDKVRVVFQLGR